MAAVPGMVLSAMSQRIAAGCQGLLFRSAVRPGGVNIVLWKTAAPAVVSVFDPNNDLPRDASSWASSW
jgi:RES domain.